MRGRECRIIVKDKADGKGREGGGGSITFQESLFRVRKPVVLSLSLSPSSFVCVCVYLCGRQTKQRERM